MVAVFAAIAAMLIVIVSTSSASASTGGVGTGGSGASASSTPRKAHLRHGRAIPPSNAPARIRRAIAAGNKIRHKPYKWGGGHSRWNDSGYDCSGTVSFILHAARMLNRPKTSGSLARWRKKGRGRWISVRANRNHTYIVVAGLRMDTSGTGGRGPRWHRRAPFTSTNGPFRTRHYSSKY